MYSQFMIHGQKNIKSPNIVRVVSCAVPVWNVSWMLFQEERSLNFSQDGELGRPHTLAIILTSSVLEFMGNKQ